VDLLILLQVGVVFQLLFQVQLLQYIGPCVLITILKSHMLVDFFVVRIPQYRIWTHSIQLLAVQSWVLVVLKSRNSVELSTLNHQLLLKRVPILSIVLIQIRRIHQVARYSSLIIIFLHLSKLVSLIHIYQVSARLEL